MSSEVNIPLSQRAMGVQRADYLDGLNPAQREAVEALDGPVMVLAGAGTGKTKTLIARIGHLILSHRARPDQVLAVTFTNKAAREMKDRLENAPYMLEAAIPWMGTFHSICAKLLRRHAELVDLKSNFTILDTDDQIRLLKQLIVAEGLDEKRWPARALAGIIDHWKNRGWGPDQIPTSEASAFDGRGVPLYAAYQKRLVELNAVDFGDLILHMLSIFKTHEDVLEKYRGWFRYILVDEYQDTNVAQYLWLRLLAGRHQNIYCVGDDDQTIYGWRGAEVGKILKFESDFTGAVVVKLEQNYRSTEHILAAASAVIEGNKGRLGKTLWTARDHGEKVRLIGHWDGDAEARWVGEEIEAMHRGSSSLAKNRLNIASIANHEQILKLAEDGLGRRTRRAFVQNAIRTKIAYSDPKAGDLVRRLISMEEDAQRIFSSILDSPMDRFNLNEIAILVRASHQMRAFEDRFLSIGLPYRVIGGPRFYERMEIRDAMAYFRLAVSPSDDLAFERIFNTPRRGLGDIAHQKIQMTAREHGVSLVEGARILCETKGIGGKGGAELAFLVGAIDRWSMQIAQGASHIEMAELILDESGYTTMWQNDKTPEAPGRLENLKELVKALEGFENLQGFLEHVSLIMDNDNEASEDKVTLMTLHAAKGLEYGAIFLPGWEDGLFPSQRSMDESGVKGLEEERRLAYVGITRAEEVCTISFAGNRRVYGQWQSQLPSRFIDELPEAHVDVLTPSGLYGGQQTVRSDIAERAAEADVYSSPGWRRMQARGTAQARRTPQVIDAQAIAAFTVGDRVFQTKFGYGEITAIDGDKLKVDFDKAGEKMIKASFVVPADKAGDVPF